jgi:hypothetical protein
MASARPVPLDRPAAPAGKRGFANRVLDFANRVRPARPLPGFPYLWIAGGVAVVVMVVVGGFGTGAMPLGRRIAFWLLLMGWSTVKWQAWFYFTVRKQSDWLWSSAASVLVLAVPIPLEIRLFARMIGVNGSAPPLFDTWGRALAIGVCAFAGSLLVIWRLARQNAEPVAGGLPAGGLLDRARVRPEAVAGIEAEDHYCRVRRRDGGGALIHYRFGDAMREVAGLDGLQVHRGAWVAAGAVTGAVREGRRWLLLLEDGSRVAVSATYVAAVRARGWLRS